jgi:hypothetical protein
MSEIERNRKKRAKTGGRQKGTPNRITFDLRQALRDLADGYAPRVRGWLDQAAEKDPAEATRLWLALLRFVTPQLAAAAIADITPKSAKGRLLEMTDEELIQEIINFPEAAKLARDGVKTMDELLVRMASPKALAPVVGAPHTVPDDDELLR